MNIIARLSGFIRLLYSLNPSKRKIILNIFDVITLVMSFYISLFFFLSFSSYEILNIGIFEINYFLFIYSSIAILFYNLSGTYKSIVRYFKSTFIYKHFLRNIVVLIIYSIFSSLQNSEILSFKFIFIFSMINTFLSILYRLIIRDFVLLSRKLNKDVENVVIYGISSNAIQLAQSLHLNNNYRVRNFIIDDKNLWGKEFLGLKVVAPDKLLKNKSYIDKIFLVLDENINNNKGNILRKLHQYSIPILQLPPFDKIGEGKTFENNLQTIDIQDLLGRKVVNPDCEILGKSVKNASVCVVGAGGSIGSEICDQLINLRPSKIILVDSCEYNLYSLEINLRNKLSNNLDLEVILGCAKDEIFMEKIFKDNNVDIVFHAAAYKHVPIVEKNPISGLSNNIISTYSLCKASKKSKVKKFVLISSDKAVRPKNIMGASKRLSEIIVQAFADSENKNSKIPKIKFSMVRFGNVLNSSGSVLPLFKKQIDSGGPITITHKDVKRYFMTIKEAAQLVIQTLELSNNGEIFILDMGKQIKIETLAKQMILLNGKKIKDNENKRGDIEIKYIGLREGEKMYEELLIDTTAVNTSHPLIFKAVEKGLPFEFLIAKLKELDEYLSNYDRENALKVLSELVPEWERWL